MYFIYQKDSLTGKVTASINHELPRDLNDKPIPIIQLISLTTEEEAMSISELEQKYPRL